MKQLPTHRAQGGSFILEAIISLMLFAIGIISLLGLVVQALNQVGQSKSRNDASYLAGELISEMWVRTTVNVGGQAGDDCTVAGKSWDCRVKELIPTATPAVYVNQSCDCRPAVGNCVAPASTGANVAVTNQAPVTICISWTDKKDAAAGLPHLYQTSSMVTHN